LKIHVYDRDGKKHSVEGEVGDVLMTPLRTVDLVDGTCGGSCSCATCHVYIDEKTFAQLPEQSEEESEVIEFMEKVEATSRLACQITLTEALDGMTATVAQEEGF
jgi:2Fe-2S ferredoxin|tara:strand:- start:766 stop:1080 length:315 start_codon:yes stop_codon:yes gene_type:complete